MAHCNACCLRIALHKRTQLPLHFTDELDYGWFIFSGNGSQQPCKGSGSTNYTSDQDIARRCTRPRGNRTCPACNRRRLKLNANGRYPFHRAPNGQACRLAEANRSHPRG